MKKKHEQEFFRIGWFLVCWIETDMLRTNLICSFFFSFFFLSNQFNALCRSTYTQKWSKWKQVVDFPHNSTIDQYLKRIEQQKL